MTICIELSDDGSDLLIPSQSVLSQHLVDCSIQAAINCMLLNMGEQQKGINHAQLLVSICVPVVLHSGPD